MLSAVHYNLGKTLLDVENIVALPHEAGSAEAMLREDVQLMQVSRETCYPYNMSERRSNISKETVELNKLISSFGRPLVTCERDSASHAHVS